MAKVRYFKGSKYIGENIKAIKEANNLTWEEFDAIVHIGVSKLQKADSGLVHFSDEELSTISGATNIPMHAIKDMPNDEFVRTFNLYKKSKAFVDKAELKDIFEEYSDDSNDFISLCFPIVIPSNLESCEPLQEVKRRLTLDSFFNKDSIQLIIRKLDEAIECGLDKETAALDLNSIIGLHYLFYCSGYTSMHDVSIQLHRKFDSQLSAFKFASDLQLTPVVKKRKAEFFETYDPYLNLCFDILLASKNYRENAEFFLFIRYLIGMDTHEMTSEERRHISEAILAFLIQTKNSLAIKFAKK